MKKNYYKSVVFAFLIFSSSILNAQQIKKTQILILGTLHLNQIEGIESKHVDRVLDSLTQFEFDVIGIEKMPVELIQDIRNRKTPHWQELFSYFETPIEKGNYYQKQLALSYEKAELIIDSLLTKKNFTENDRIDLIKAFLCTYDPWSAALHYGFVQNKTIIDTTITEFMNNYIISKNEINLIGINLSKRLAINRLYSIDNLQDETILLHEFPEFINDYTNSKEKISELLNNPFFGRVDSIQSYCVNQGDLYNAYKFINSIEYMDEDKKGQWDIWLKTNFKSKTDRSRYSLWEMRNLQITANITRLIAAHPERKILIIIGSAHKSFIEKYLNQMDDIEVLEF